MLRSAYVNDFNKFGRTFQVRVQADQRFRLEPEDIRRLNLPLLGLVPVPVPDVPLLVPDVPLLCLPLCVSL